MQKIVQHEAVSPTAPDACLLNEEAIPHHLRAKARAWFDNQMAQCAAKHGPRWPEHREWVADYLNAELREHLEGRE